LKLFRESGMPRRIPPALPECTSTDSLEAPRISSPLRSVSYTLHRANSQDVVALETSVAADVRNVFWFDGSALIGKQPVSEGAMPWRPSNDGVHLLRVIDDHGRSAERDVEVQFTP